MSQMQEVTAIMKEWGTHRRELFEQYCKEKDKDASIIFNEEEWSKFAEWEKNNDVIAREVRIYKCDKIDYGFNADNENEVDYQWEVLLNEWLASHNSNQLLGEHIHNETLKRYGLDYDDDGYDEKWYEVMEDVISSYRNRGVEGFVDIMNDFGGDYYAALKEYNADDCDNLGMTVEELRECAENERVFRGGLDKQRRWR